jgi:transposase
MARYEVSDELWARIQPLLPLNGILFVLLTGIRWTDLPQQLGYDSGMTCWRRLRDWQAAGVWDQLHALLLAQLRAAGRLDLARAVADGSHVRALKGGQQPDRARSTAAGRLQASRPDRRDRHPAGRAPDRRQPSRRHPAHAAAGCGPANPRAG